MLRSVVGNLSFVCIAKTTEFQNRSCVAPSVRVGKLARPPPSTRTMATSVSTSTTTTYSDPDQERRHSKAVSENNQRVLNIDSVYESKKGELKGKRVLVTGCSRGLGLALVKELLANDAKVIGTVRKMSPAFDEFAKKAGGNLEVISDVDVTSDAETAGLPDKISEPIDILINNAGFFYGPKETLQEMNFEMEIKQIDITGIGPLRVTSALFNAGKLKSGSKVALVSSQGGSIAWRTVQNPDGADYGHHMSKACENMAGMLLSQELKSSGISVIMLHPGFNRTEMTKKYEEIWDREGAVDPSVGAKRVLYEVIISSMANTGKFVNTEDGLEIPW